MIGLVGNAAPACQMGPMTSETAKKPLAPRETFDRRGERGPFDIVGDVHGCADELSELLTRLGYKIVASSEDGACRLRIEPPPGRRAVLVGDLVDRGPASPEVMRIVIAMAEAGQAFAVPGNHDVKFVRWLEGREVALAHGLERTAEQFLAESAAFRDRVRAFLSRLPIYLWLDGGALAVAHAGIRETMLGHDSAAIRSFCLYGETTGEMDELGLPVRYHWAADYRHETAVVYGHTPVPDADWVNNTLCVDTGCCFGGRLTALRWPEREIVSVPARETYAPPRRPFGHPPVRPGVET